MARLAREAYLYDDCYIHAISRSIRKLKLFQDEEDFNKILELLNKTRKEFNYTIFHYCIMQTHFHLAVRIGKINDFSKAMQTIKSSYSYYFHEKYQLSGPIWRERYRSLLIENEDYLHACGEYIENNPVKADIVKQSADWLYSSAKYYQNRESDELMEDVDGYSRRANTVHVHLEEEEFYEKGSVVGSAFYRFQFKEKIKGVKG